MRLNAPWPRTGISSASDVVWEDYYVAVEGRELRPLFVEAVRLLSDMPPPGRMLEAVDLGCGDGLETLDLLARGWTVVAIDGSEAGVSRLRAAVSSEHRLRLTTRVTQFTESDLPAADFVYAGFSLPFCDPGDFDVAWSRIGSAIRPGGLFAGHLFGPNDSWYGTPDMAFHTRSQVDELCSGFVDVIVTEQDEDGHSAAGPKHWHVFSVIARKPVPRSG